MAALETSEHRSAVTLTLSPHSRGAVGVVLYLLRDSVGTVALDDQASVPAELGNDEDADPRPIDQVLEVAVTGTATAFHPGRGGCMEEQDAEGNVMRSWHDAWPWPGWRRRATRIDYAPYH